MATNDFKNFDVSSYLSETFGNTYAVFAGAAALLSSELTKYTALASIEAFNHSYEKLASVLDNSYKILTKFDSSTMLEQVVARIFELTSVLDIDFSLSETVSQLSESLDSLSKSFNIPENLSCLEQSEVSVTDLAAVLTQGLSFEQEYVTLTDDAVETFSDFLSETDTVPANPVKNKMSAKDFVFCILLPILAIILPMIQSSYYHKVDSIDAQQQQTQEAIYQEQRLSFKAQLLEEERLQSEEAQMQSEYLQQLIDLLSSLEVSQEVPPVTPSVPAEPSVAPEISEEVLLDDGTVLDGPDAPDSNE